MQKETYSVQHVPREAIRPDPDQPRKVFAQEELEALAASIHTNGLLQPISIRPDKEQGKYLLIAGERRWRATGLLEWAEVPAIVWDEISEQHAAKLQLLENIVRVDLNPVEEAEAYRRLLEGGHTVKGLAETLGKRAQDIQWKLDILGCRADILHLVSNGQMTWSMAWELGKLSQNGQGKALRLMTGQKLSHEEVLAMCASIQAEESQTVMALGVMEVPDEHRRVAKSFGEAFERVAALLNKLEKLEERKPGSMGAALAAEGEVAQLKVDEMTRALGRVKKAIVAARVSRAVAEVA